MQFALVIEQLTREIPQNAGQNLLPCAAQARADDDRRRPGATAAGSLAARWTPR